MSTLRTQSRRNVCVKNKAEQMHNVTADHYRLNHVRAAQNPPKHFA